MSRRDGNRRRSAFGVLPVALRAGQVVMAVHGVLVLAGIDLVWWGPVLSRAQCLEAVVACLTGWLWHWAQRRSVGGG